MHWPELGVTSISRRSASISCGFQSSPGAHGTVAGHGCSDVHEAALERQSLIPFADVFGQVAHEARAIDLAEQRRRLAQRHGAGAEGFQHDAISRKFLGMREQTLDFRLVEFDDIGDEQDLARDAGFADRGLELLVDDAFVGGVLIDDDETVAGLRHDVGVVHLRARRTKRMIERIPRGIIRRRSGAKAGIERRNRPRSAPARQPRMRLAPPRQNRRRG